MKVSNKDGSVYGHVVVERNLFIKSKWKEINVGKKLPRDCAQDFYSEHDTTTDFWSKFREISNSEYNELWARDMNSVRYQPKKI